MNNEKLTAPNMNLLKLQRYQSSNHDSLVRLGMQTWESAKFKGTLYDFDTPIDEFLNVYASQYDSVEFHESFFDLPSERKMEALRLKVENVNKNFKFCPVIPRRISHEFPLGENVFETKEFIESINQLGDHLGPCILRLPETLSPMQMRSLDKFFKVWPSDKRVAIQFTNLEWIKKPSFLNLVAKEIQGTLFSILIEDRIEHEIDFGKLVASDHLIVRFFGRPSMNQDEQRLAMWVYRLGEYKGYGVKNPYFFLYEQEEMCLSILRKMANSMGGNIRVPSSFDQNSKQMGFSF